MALFGALDQIFADQLEVAAFQIQEKDSIKEVADKAATSTDTEVQVMSRINRSLLLGPVIDKTGAPGSVYVVNKLTKPFREAMDGLVPDTLISPSPDWKQSKQDEYEAAKTQSVAIAVEITPVCDHQQDKHKVVRLLGGIAVPVQLVKLICKADYVRSFPSIGFADEVLSGDYVLAWNTHYLVTRARSTLGPRHPPAYRVRPAALADLITFQANHAARPGYLSIRG